MKRAQIQGSTVNVPYKKTKTVIEWKVCDDEDGDLLERIKTVVSRHEAGLTNFDFTKLEVADSCRRISRINFMKLFFDFWPGNLHYQLLMLNTRIEKDNVDRKKNKMAPVSLREFGIFIGIMLAARLEGKKGEQLWQGCSDDGEGYRSQVDLSRFMTRHRHSQIRAYLAYIWADDSIQHDDPWWMIIRGIDEFNHNRSLIFKPGPILTIDEIMSAFRPRKSATGESNL